MNMQHVQRPGQTLVNWLGTLASVGALMLGVEAYYATSHPIAAAATLPAAIVTSVPEPRVWYNRRTGVYHDGACRWYLRTREGMELGIGEASRLGNPCHACVAAPPKRAKGQKVEQRIYMLK